MWVRKTRLIGVCPMAYSLVTNHPTSIFLIPSLNQAHSDQQRGYMLRKLPCPTTQEPIWQSHLHHLSWHRSPFAAAPPWGRWFLLYLSVAVTWLWHRSLSPLLCKVLAPPGLMPGASVTQSSICSLHIQPPALNDFLTLCYKRGVSHRQVQQFQKRGHVGLHLLSELQPSICAVWTPLFLKLGKVPR